MLGNNRRTIGVFVTQQFQEYQDQVCRGICARAVELGYNVAVFTNFLGYGDFQYEIGERSIADLPKYNTLDGIILLPDTMYVPKFLNSMSPGKILAAASWRIALPYSSIASRSC